MKKVDPRIVTRTLFSINDWLSTEDRWCRGMYAQRYGDPIEPCIYDANQMSLEGVLLACFGFRTMWHLQQVNDPDANKVLEFLNQASQELVGMDVHKANDDPDVTFEMIKSIISEAYQFAQEWERQQKEIL